MRPSVVCRTVFAALCVAVAPSASSGQSIAIRTVPVASGDQFLLLPGTTLGLGNVDFAVADTLADPWGRPASGALIRESAFLVSPTMYGISEDGGAGRTFPLAVMATSGSWFAGGAAALQQVENSGDRQRIFIDPWFGWPGPQRLRDRSNRNLYARGFVGRRIEGTPWSVGLGAGIASLDAMDGVDLLYAGSSDIRQDGRMADVRLGLHREEGDQSLDLTLLHSRVDIDHEVTWVDWTVRPDSSDPRFSERVELNQDQSRTWGGRVAWTRDLSAQGWTVGLAGTLNRKTHPKIPNYQIQNIPRDPGESWAWEAGAGLSHRGGGTLFAVDVAVQPIWSDTWQEADSSTVSPTGRSFAPGDRTIENDFFFTNVLLRSGFQYTFSRADVQVGVEARSYQYELLQSDHLADSTRRQDEAWLEWTPTFGAAYRFSGVELRYVGRVTTGTGQPGVDRGFDRAVLESASGDFIIAPQGPLTLRDVRVVTHQLAARIPIR